MNWRTKRALGIAAAIVLISIWLATPLMRAARGRTWNVWVTTIVRVFRLPPIAVNNDVQSRLETLVADNIRLNHELQDYIRLREQLGAPAFAQFRPLPAVVVGRPIDTFQSQFVINRGAQDGVSIGAPAVINSSVLVGFVTQLEQKTAVITLLFHPQTSVTAYVRADTPEIAAGLIKGDRYTTVHLTTVPRDFALSEGQEVLTQGSPQHVPAGLLIGRIHHFVSDETSIYHEAVLKVPYDPDQLAGVTILGAP